MSASDKLPATGMYYDIKFGSKAKGVFTACEGLIVKVSVVEHKASGAQGKPVYQRLPGSPEGGQITLKRAMVDGDAELGKWVEESHVDNKKARVDGTVQMLDNKQKPIRTFTISNAWVIEYSVTPMSGAGGLTEETVVLAHEGIKVKA